MRMQRGFSLIELLIVIAIILIIAAIAIPSLMRGRIAANEASAVSAVRSITSAQLQYKMSHDIYAPDMASLGTGNAELLNGDLGTAPFIKSGYQFNTVGTDNTFLANGSPTNPGANGIRSFCTDTPAVIRYAPSGAVCDPATSPVLAQ